ncbi:hypothetical protein HK104_007960 [Borealophlyctis nickersoniae]|nr:hypothetical protein HK104_007960 [Borealophlyctis nickersoniae]
MPGHRHIPLIKFLGPRSKLPAGLHANTSPSSHPFASSTPAPAAPTPTAKPTKGHDGPRILSYDNVKAMPKRYWINRQLSALEMEAIEVRTLSRSSKWKSPNGGAGYIITGA